MARVSRPTTQRLWEKIRVQENGCWLFMGATDSKGYGCMRVDGDFGAATQRAHRVSYMAFRGDIPEGMDVLHHCDTPRCVHPEHLFCGFQAANHRDMCDKGRDNHFGHKTRKAAEAADDIAA